MEFPTVEEVLALHEQILAATGGTQGVLHRGSIDSAIERAKWGPFNQGPDLPQRAALLLRGVCQDHPFADGNKRTAFSVADGFLARNGFRVAATADEVTSFMLDVAQGKTTLRQIARWIETHQRKD